MSRNDLGRTADGGGGLQGDVDGRNNWTQPFASTPSGGQSSTPTSPESGFGSLGRSLSSREGDEHMELVHDDSACEPESAVEERLKALRRDMERLKEREQQLLQTTGLDSSHQSGDVNTNQDPMVEEQMDEPMVEEQADEPMEEVEQTDAAQSIAAEVEESLPASDRLVNALLSPFQRGDEIVARIEFDSNFSGQFTLFGEEVDRALIEAHSLIRQQCPEQLQPDRDFVRVAMKTCVQQEFTKAGPKERLFKARQLQVFNIMQAHFNETSFLPPPFVRRWQRKRCEDVVSPPSKVRPQSDGNWERAVEEEKRAKADQQTDEVQRSRRSLFTADRGGGGRGGSRGRRGGSGGGGRGGGGGSTTIVPIGSHDAPLAYRDRLRHFSGRRVVFYDTGWQVPRLFDSRKKEVDVHDFMARNLPGTFYDAEGVKFFILDHRGRLPPGATYEGDADKRARDDAINTAPTGQFQSRLGVRLENLAIQEAAVAPTAATEGDEEEVSTVTLFDTEDGEDIVPDTPPRLQPHFVPTFPPRSRPPSISGGLAASSGSKSAFGGERSSAGTPRSHPARVGRGLVASSGSKSAFGGERSSAATPHSHPARDGRGLVASERLKSAFGGERSSAATPQSRPARDDRGLAASERSKSGFGGDHSSAATPQSRPARDDRGLAAAEGLKSAFGGDRASSATPHSRPARDDRGSAAAEGSKSAFGGDRSSSATPHSRPARDDRGSAAAEGSKSAFGGDRSSAATPQSRPARDDRGLVASERSKSAIGGDRSSAATPHTGQSRDDRGNCGATGNKKSRSKPTVSRPDVDSAQVYFPANRNAKANSDPPFVPEAADEQHSSSSSDSDDDDDGAGGGEAVRNENADDDDEEVVGNVAQPHLNYRHCKAAADAVIDATRRQGRHVVPINQNLTPPPPRTASREGAHLRLLTRNPIPNSAIRNEIRDAAARRSFGNMVNAYSERAIDTLNTVVCEFGDDVLGEAGRLSALGGRVGIRPSDLQHALQTVRRGWQLAPTQRQMRDYMRHVLPRQMRGIYVPRMAARREASSEDPVATQLHHSTSGSVSADGPDRQAAERAIAEAAAEEAALVEDSQSELAQIGRQQTQRSNGAHTERRSSGEANGAVRARQSSSNGAHTERRSSGEANGAVRARQSSSTPPASQQPTQRSNGAHTERRSSGEANSAVRARQSSSTPPASQQPTQWSNGAQTERRSSGEANSAVRARQSSSTPPAGQQMQRSSSSQTDRWPSNEGGGDRDRQSSVQPAQRSSSSQTDRRSTGEATSAVRDLHSLAQQADRQQTQRSNGSQAERRTLGDASSAVRDRQSSSSTPPAGRQQTQRSNGAYTERRSLGDASGAVRERQSSAQQIGRQPTRRTTGEQTVRRQTADANGAVRDRQSSSTLPASRQQTQRSNAAHTERRSSGDANSAERDLHSLAQQIFRQPTQRSSSAPTEWRSLAEGSAVRDQHLSTPQTAPRSIMTPAGSGSSGHRVAVNPFPTSYYSPPPPPPPTPPGDFRAASYRPQSQRPQSQRQTKTLKGRPKGKLGERGEGE